MARVRSTAEQLKRWLADLSIQIKLIGAYIVIILVPVIVISNYLFTGFYQNTIKDIIKENRYQTDNEKQEIMSRIGVMEQSIGLLVSDRQLREYVTVESEPGLNDIKRFQEYSFTYLQTVLFNNSDIANIHFFVNNPWISELWPIIYHEERIKDKPFYTKMLNQNGKILWEIQPEDAILQDSNDAVNPSSSSIVSLMAGVNQMNSQNLFQHLGIVKVDMPIGNFFKKAYNNSSDRDSRFYILDQQGNLHANSTDPLPGLDEADIQQAVAKYKQAGKSSLLLSHKGEDFLYLVEPIDKINAELINVISLHTTYSKIDHTRNTVIVVILFLLMLLAITTFFMQSIILNKLNILRDSMKQVRGGDFGVDIDVTGGDEIGELAHHFRQMLNTINGMIADAVKRSAATKEAELQALHNQIDAHFLYNTLENLKMLAEVEGQYVVSDALTSLGSMMRYNLRWTGDRVQLRDEMGHIQHYIAIMSIRYDEKLKLEIEVEDRFWDHEILKMSLQPIVENALKHGVYSALMKSDGLIVAIHAFEDGGFFYIEVTDNGIGIAEDKLQELNRKLIMSEEEFNALPRETAETTELNKGSGIGLRNVNQRIQMVYGNEHGLQIESKRGSYTQVTVKLPLLTSGRGGTQII
ncbi:cache domain-containing sensor histidine kinase [Paenibacillus sp. FSL R10-2736]|uniref:cache domain-containing sensor histidine kinase n=1 Tax=Paenibacillus sp. FSL R10-2736 TaxID=2954692 RepID=UPI0030F5E4F7